MFPHALLRACLVLALLACALAQPPHDVVKFSPFDLSSISLYGPLAIYRPQWCPSSVSFAMRARALPELADDKIGLFTSDIYMDDQPCTSSTSMLLFTPIGRPPHLPPQWVFEDSAISGNAVNFTCGSSTYAIRYGYLNDVHTPSGFLDDTVVYLDFAVIPNTLPFSFCSYATRRNDNERPVDHAPFPTVQTWNKIRATNDLPPLPEPDSQQDVEQMPVPSAEPVEPEMDAIPSPEDTEPVPMPPMLFPSPEAAIPAPFTSRLVDALTSAVSRAIASIRL